ncbi:sigma-54-dependent transcriptional regulator [Pelobacter seleniigenes]|uniref:sigma-54-dependent transcriptional regulator n=1 Tax=Pelobacter seleniigenes TaxID=407188 RepID=UPI0004A6FE7C|nr:sigma-54 dependent transcriptional regulator [Pelobacter seleniigenes]
MAHILLVDDEKNYRIILTRLLEAAGHRVSAVENPFAALELLQREDVALILSDLRMPKMDGMEFFQAVREQHEQLPFIILTAFATVETALQAIKSGAFDYLTKPFKNEEILVVVEKALDYSRLRTENDLLRRQLELGAGRELLGSSPAIRALLDHIARVGPAPTSILICGESGTGKELVARALHRASARRQGALISVNCAVFSETLLESELFGHERGAFTGATERKRGLLEMADGGTLFLDEIGEMSLGLQPKLLRLLQEKRFRRVGGNAEIACDARIVAATNRNLQEMIAAGSFREDLYYRLNVVTLTLPPLRERAEDIALLALHFLTFYARKLGRPVQGIAAETLQLLQRYDWPGNVRELQNIIERGVLFSRAAELLPEDLPLSLRETDSGGGASPWQTADFSRSLPERLEEIEADLVRQAMVKARGVQAAAARLLGISRSNLQYKLKKFGLMES